MSDINNGGPAFPLDFIPENCPKVPTGMTMRDYFAAKAVSGLCSATTEDGTWAYGCVRGVAETAYQIADAMLKAREVQS